MISPRLQLPSHFIITLITSAFVGSEILAHAWNSSDPQGWHSRARLIRAGETGAGPRMHFLNRSLASQDGEPAGGSPCWLKTSLPLPGASV
jgi:hypothetical protein